MVSNYVNAVDMKAAFVNSEVLYGVHSWPFLSPLRLSLKEEEG